MASLEDVKRYVREHADWDGDKIASHVAREFGMSREDADRMVADFSGGGTTADTVNAPLVDALGPAAVAGSIAGGVGGTGTSGVAGAGGAALGLAAVEAERREADIEGNNTGQTRDGLEADADNLTRPA